jgi:anti-sigma factor RsiW
MNCKQASKMLSLRLDDLLDDEEITLLEEHMAGCSACQVEWHSLQALDNLFASVPMARPPVRVRVQVMARVSRRDQARRAIVGGMTLTLGTVALALLAIAPVALNLLNVTGIAPALINGGPQTVVQLSTFASTMGRALWVLIEQFALPLASLGMCSLVAALILNSLWIGAMRRLRIKS